VFRLKIIKLQVIRFYSTLRKYSLTIVSILNPFSSFKKAFLYALLLLTAFPFAFYSKTKSDYNPTVYSDVAAIPENHAALILGAGINSNTKTPSSILYDRVLAGVKLYNSGKVKKLIMSGDNRYQDYNEPDVMKQTAVDLGVPEYDIQPDYAGRRTYDSCYRAKHIFSQETITVVTQSFHIYRSLYVCHNLGIQSVGFLADQRKDLYRAWNYWQFRDKIALTKSIIDLKIKKPSVVGGDKIPL